MRKERKDISLFTALAVAAVCHEANRTYCATLGDRSQPSWRDAPDWQRNSAVTGVLFHAQNPNAGPEASHESWMAQKEKDGWIYGEKKDENAKTHPCMVDFVHLPPEQQAKDFIFRAIVHAMVHDSPLCPPTRHDIPYP